MSATDAPTSNLTFPASDKATARIGSARDDELSAFVIQALQHHASAAAGDKAAKLVSVSLDMTGKDASAGTVQIDTKTDRQTRSLLFLGADLVLNDTLLVKATAIFRLG